MQVKKQQLEPGMEQRTGSKLVKEYVKAIYCHPAYLTYMQRTSCKMPDQMKHSMESRLPGKNINNLRYAYDTTVMAESEEELKMKVKEESEKAGLKLSIPKSESWEIDGETVEMVSYFIFWGSKITVDGDCSHEIKRHLLLERKVMTNLERIFKSRDTT